MGVGNSLLDGEFVGQQNLVFHLAGGGVKDVGHAATALDQFAANEVADGEIFGHRSLVREIK